VVIAARSKGPLEAAAQELAAATDRRVVPIVADTGSESSVNRELAANVGIGRIADAREVAYVVAFLASPKSASINGDALPMGGGSLGSIYD
jgi:hypothetical protein